MTLQKIFYKHSMVLQKDRITGKRSFLTRLGCWVKLLSFWCNHLDFFRVLSSLDFKLDPSEAQPAFVLSSYLTKSLRKQCGISVVSQDEPGTELWLQIWPLPIFFYYFLFPPSLHQQYRLMPGMGKAKISTVIWQSQILYSLPGTRTCTKHRPCWEKE